jgi:hypothetical protein
VKKAELAVAAILSAFVLPSGGAFANGVPHPTVVELFQSQGCSDCPPANANVMALSDRPDLLTLSFGVTYWDQLGWKDTFASPQYTARQWDYAHAFKRDQVFTPEVVVNGRADVVGSNRAELEQLIRGEAAAQEDAPVARIDKGVVSVSTGKPTNAEVWLVRYDPRILQVPISAGENSGVTLPHKNVVRQLLKLGNWSGEALTYSIPNTPDKEYREAVLVQAGPGGDILAAAHN